MLVADQMSNERLLAACLPGRTVGLVLALVIVVVLGTRFYGPTGIPRRKLFRFYCSLPTYWSNQCAVDWCKEKETNSIRRKFIHELVLFHIFSKNISKLLPSFTKYILLPWPWLSILQSIQSRKSRRSVYKSCIEGISDFSIRGYTLITLARFCLFLTN